MKKFVINLPDRQDRMEKFANVNADKLDQVAVMPAVDGRKLTYTELTDNGFDTDKFWRDPILKRTLTWGEVGCFLSHYELWQRCAEDEEQVPYMVIEDDAVFQRHSNELLQYLGDFEFLYLSHCEQKEAGAQHITPELIKPCYPYWTTAYIVTPEAAKKLIGTDIQQNIIPVDEYLPRMLDKMHAAAFVDPPVKQMPREEAGTNVEPSSEADFVVDFKTYALTCGDYEDRMGALLESSRRCGVRLTNVIKHPWAGGTMEGPGGGQKLCDLKAWIEDNCLEDYDVILFTDAFDTFYCRDLETIVGRFLGYKKEIVFSAEQYLWPDKSLRFPPSHTKFRYLNSGTFIGRVGEIKRMLGNDMTYTMDDQLYLQKQYLTGRFNATLDYEGYIFATNDSMWEIRNGVPYHPGTKCFSCIYHGNGGDEAKEHFRSLFTKAHPEQKYLVVRDWQTIGQEMLLIDFMTPAQCQEWIDLSEHHGGWNPHPADKFPSHDIHLKNLGLWEEMEDHWKRVIAPITNKVWAPSLHYHLRKAFTMKYSEDTQKTLGFHTDASLVTGSVKLNDDYEGATLVFPRQNFNNHDIPVGKMILFPGPLTHGHYVEPLKSGTKYSATFWTARFEGDYLDP